MKIRKVYMIDVGDLSYEKAKMLLDDLITNYKKGIKE